MQPLAGTMRHSPSTPSVEEISRRVATQDRKSLLYSNRRKIDHQHRTALLRLAEWALRHAPAKVGCIHANNTFPADFV
jgi:hypothetical protein